MIGDDSKTTRDQLETEGFMAAVERKDIELCPYEKDDDRRTPWLWGWRAATAEDHADLEAMMREDCHAE